MHKRLVTATATSPSDRAGDRDRQKAAAQLGQALAQGYLDLHEYEERVQVVFQAHTTGQLKELLADLPLDRIRRADPRRRAARMAAARRGVRIHLGAFVAMIAVVFTVWAAVAVTTGAWYFWPIWPILGGAIGLISHTLAVPGPRRLVNK
ncbi:MAG TPA: DUF1707 domain-containing protein [Mycobacterium sp.]|nr:DUF1707 domain-containing protein [Mycobacterium sp.]HUH72553.1 DUF1707 domain-containing protein [Mycobacterium sp.]